MKHEERIVNVFLEDPGIFDEEDISKDVAIGAPDFYASHKKELFLCFLIYGLWMIMHYFGMRLPELILIICFAGLVVHVGYLMLNHHRTTAWTQETSLNGAIVIDILEINRSKNAIIGVVRKSKNPITVFLRKQDVNLCTKKSILILYLIKQKEKEGHM